MTDFNPSSTHRVRTGCGNLYICIDFNQDGSIHKIRIPRNTKFNCSLIVRDSLAKQATFQVRRDPAQLIKDLKGSKAHACEKYNITCQAFSCSDALAQVIQTVVGNNTIPCIDKNINKEQHLSGSIDVQGIQPDSCKGKISVVNTYPIQKSIFPILEPEMHSLGDIGKL